MFRRRRLSRSRRKYELQGAPEFLFDSRPYELPCGDRKPGQSEVDKWRAVSFVAGNQAPYLLTRLDELRLSQADVPVLTVTADPANVLRWRAARDPIGPCASAPMAKATRKMRLANAFTSASWPGPAARCHSAVLTFSVQSRGAWAGVSFL